MYAVTLSDSAYQDLREIYSYISKDLSVPNTAAEQTLRIKQTIKSLNYFPHRHRIFREDTDPNKVIRVVVVDNYCAFYCVNDSTSTVTVIRLLSTRQNLNKALSSTTEI